MDPENNEVPVEILVDIKEDEKIVLSGTTSSKKTKIFSNTKIKRESNTKKECSNSEECASTHKTLEKWETILDISPSKICKEFNSKVNLGSEVNIEKNLKSEILDGCPIAVLIDVSPPTKFCFRDNCANGTCISTQYFKDELTCEILNMGNRDLKETIDSSLSDAKTCKMGDFYSANSNEIQSQMPMKRLRWKTPSPQSMSRISKEASKVIDYLNSSSVFDDDLLLTEEILPIPLNFDELDDDTDKRNSIDNVFEDIVVNNRPSVSDQSLSKTDENEKLNYLSSSKDVSEKIQDNLKCTIVERNIIEPNFKLLSKNGSNSKETSSSGIHSSSCGNSDSLIKYDNTDDVFNMTHIASGDKENLQNKKNRENKVGNKTATKTLSLNKPKFDKRSTLRNLSNIKPDTSNRRLSLSVNKNVTTPLKRISMSTNKKSIAYHNEKPQMKKTAVSVDSHCSMKGFSQSKSLQFQNTVSSAQKPCPIIKINSGCSSLSSGVKQQNVFATPSKRYSDCCTPLKSASAIKPPLTPAMTGLHNFAFPRYTPQPAKPSRLSFSRSWQQSGNNSEIFSTKGQQMFSIVPTSASKIVSGIKNSSKAGKLSFSQSMSAVPGRSLARSTSSKGKFSSKLPSPLSIEKNKKVARALFTSISEK